MSSKLKTFDRNNAWWLWVCTHAPLVHVRCLAMDMDAMERLVVNRDKEIEGKEREIKSLSEFNSSLHKGINELLANKGLEKSLLVEIDGLICGMLSSPRLDRDAMFGKVSRVRELLVRNITQNMDGPAKIEPPRPMNLKDITRMGREILEDAPPITLGVQPSGEVLSSKERWDELIEAESNNEYLTRTLERREVALKGAHDLAECRKADNAIMAQKVEKLEEDAKDIRCKSIEAAYRSYARTCVLPIMSPERFNEEHCGPSAANGYLMDGKAAKDFEKIALKRENEEYRVRGLEKAAKLKEAEAKAQILANNMEQAIFNSDTASKSLSVEEDKIRRAMAQTRAMLPHSTPGATVRRHAVQFASIFGIHIRDNDLGCLCETNKPND